tara:strand:+ start:172 stop:756 length:585 start_codon:yes stop_codon:yes gene_type:complete
MGKDLPNYLIELAREELCVSTEFSTGYYDDPHFIGATCEAFIRDGSEKILIAKADIYAVDKSIVSDRIFHICDELIESSDLLKLAYAMTEICDEESEWYNMEIDCSRRVYFIEHFKVCSGFRGKGLGRDVARKILINAGATSCPIFLTPDTYSDEDGPNLDIVEKFWLGLQEDVCIMDKPDMSRKVFYIPEFNP